jgi:hypothetical protein
MRSSRNTKPAANDAAADLARRPFIEQKAALTLAQMAGSNTDLTLSGDHVEGLVNALIVLYCLTRCLKYILTLNSLRLRKTSLR